MSDAGAIWAQLATPAGALSARLHPESADVWLGIDASQRRHLLVRATGEESGQHLLTTHGLQATTERLSLEGEPLDVWADIVCLNAALNDTFRAVAEDLVLEAQNSPGDLLDAVRRTLRRWRWFWGVDASGLSEDEALGIFGEVWFIDRWANCPEVVDRWLGPTGSRHDFVSPLVSVEVKAARVRADGPVTHPISSLDQLAAAETGDLFLFSLTVMPDANASNSVPGMIGLVRNRLVGQPEALGLFDRRLAEAGWTPAAAEKHTQTFRVTAEELYRVDEGFPRLTRETFPNGLPIGVDKVSYNLDLMACAEFRVATSPEEAPPLLGALWA